MGCGCVFGRSKVRSGRSRVRLFSYAVELFCNDESVAEGFVRARNKKEAQRIGRDEIERLRTVCDSSFVEARRVQRDERGCGMGKWRPVKRVVSRREKLRRCGKGCFLDPSPEKPRYPVCKPTSCKPSCEGVLAARRRAVTQRDFGIERKAIMLGRNLGCSWAAGAVAKRGRGT